MQTFSVSSNPEVIFNGFLVAHEWNVKVYLTSNFNFVVLGENMIAVSPDAWRALYAVEDQAVASRIANSLRKAHETFVQFPTIRLHHALFLHMMVTKLYKVWHWGDYTIDTETIDTLDRVREQTGVNIVIDNAAKQLRVQSDTATITL